MAALIGGSVSGGWLPTLCRRISEQLKEVFLPK
jgi:hypothetical protein